MEEKFQEIKGYNPLTPAEDFRALYDWRILEKRAICTLRVGERESQEKDGFFFASTSVVDETRGTVSYGGLVIYYFRREKSRVE